MKSQFIINTVKNGAVKSYVVTARDRKAARKMIEPAARVISINLVKRQVNIYNRKWRYKDERD